MKFTNNNGYIFNGSTFYGSTFNESAFYGLIFNESAFNGLTFNGVYFYVDKYVNHEVMN